MNAPDETFRLLVECQAVLDTLSGVITRAALADMDVSECEPHIRAMLASLYRAQTEAAFAIGNRRKAYNDNEREAP